MVASPNSNAPRLLEMKEIVKTFPGVKALKGVSLTLSKGEVLALVGENGAGKSTLIKALGGAHLPDSGEIRIDGEAVTLRSPHVSQLEGIAIIFQEFNLVPKLSARENLFLGMEIVKNGFIDRRAERARARELFQELGMSIDPETRCQDLTVAEQQTVEIARALASDARIIVMDEPTAALSQQEVDKLLSIIRCLRDEGISIVYISHRLEEIYEIADRVTVLRDGETVGEAPVSEVSKSELIEWMVGRPLEEEFPKRLSSPGPVRLKVEGLGRGTSVKGVSFELRLGEVLGVSGLVGSGRTEMARLIFGADNLDTGEIAISGEERIIRQPRDAIRNGVCLLTEDRKEQGLILIHSAQENFGLPNLKAFKKGFLIDGKAEAQAFDSSRKNLKIKVSSGAQKAGQLSGGNQQKVVLAKWLEGNADIFIFDEPTRGIDVGAKYEIYLLINALVARGKSILLISSELPEVIGMSDRILVMKEGKVMGEIEDAQSTSQETVLALALKE